LGGRGRPGKSGDVAEGEGGEEGAVMDGNGTE
jgi:hypothetical protein